MPLNTLCNYFYILLIMKILFKEMKHLHFSHTWLPPNVYMNVISIQFCQHFWFSQHFKCREGRVPLQYVSICCATVTISTVIREDSLLVFSVLSPERHTLYRSGRSNPNYLPRYVNRTSWKGWIFVRSQRAWMCWFLVYIFRIYYCLNNPFYKAELACSVMSVSNLDKILNKFTFASFVYLPLLDKSLFHVFLPMSLLRYLCQITLRFSQFF